MPELLTPGRGAEQHLAHDHQVRKEDELKRIDTPEEYAREVLKVEPPAGERLRALRAMAKREHMETMLAHLSKGVAEGDGE